MTTALYILVLIASFAAFAEGTFWLLGQQNRNPYCHLQSCSGRKHTLCEFPTLRTSLKCGKVVSSSLTPKEIQELLNAHNKQSEVPLTWDKELAYIAQTWADQCTLRVDECRNVERFRVGQSYSYSKTTGPFRIKLEELVSLNQVPKGTTVVGCGAVRYNPDHKFNTTYLVCNYANAGY